MKTEQQLAGERVLTRVVSAVDGVAFSYPEALNVANVILKTSKKQTTRFSGELVIGNELKIPCKIFTKVSIAGLWWTLEKGKIALFSLDNVRETINLEEAFCDQSVFCQPWQHGSEI